MKKLNNESIRAVLFDFDMTLVDSSYAITACTNLLAEAKGLRQVTREEMLKVIGLPIEDAWGVLWGEVDPGWLGFYRDTYKDIEQEGFREFPGTRELPRILRKAGIKVGVVSNRKFARHAVEKSGLMPFFDVVIGLEDVKRAKPDPEPITTALERLGLGLEGAAYAGDTDIDVKTAVAAGVISIGMSTGGFGSKELKEAGADFVCACLLEIPETLNI